MDICTIHDKIKDGLYPTLDDLESDVSRLFQNAKLYHAKYSVEEYEDAKKIFDAFKTIRQRVEAACTEQNLTAGANAASSGFKRSSRASRTSGGGNTHGMISSGASSSDGSSRISKSVSRERKVNNGRSTSVSSKPPPAPRSSSKQRSSSTSRARKGKVNTDMGDSENVSEAGLSVATRDELLTEDDASMSSSTPSLRNSSRGGGNASNAATLSLRGTAESSKMTTPSPQKNRRSSSASSVNASQQLTKRNSVSKATEALVNDLRLYFGRVAYHRHKDNNNRRLIEIFGYLPSRREYPQYYEVIKNPMDMRQVASVMLRDEKLMLTTPAKNGDDEKPKYTSLVQMRDDFLLMADNAKIFNEPISNIYKSALELERVAYAFIECQRDDGLVFLVNFIQ